MKTVFSNDMVAHNWANQTQSEGRTSNGNFYFKGTVIYSYGTHFPIARHVSGGAILFTTDKYRQTTAKHMMRVRRAIPSFTTVFYVADVMAKTKTDHLKNLNKKITHVNEQFESISRARKKCWIADSVRQNISDL